MNDGALVLVALVIDRVVGEPPNVLHPVVWMGTVVKLAQRFVPSHGAAQLVWGAGVALGVPLLFAALSHVLLQALSLRPEAQFVAGALLLKTTFSLDGLRNAAVTMTKGLASTVDSARFALRSLCSRDPSALSSDQLIAATVESLAENTSDSVIAPLFYFALFGVPGAVAYRAVNTLDAMIGYHGRYEYLGKAAARLDDLLNLIPARITGCLLLLAGALMRLDVRSGWRVMRRDARNTESPNAGYPMSAMAGLLGVQLSKEGHYVLGDARADLSAATIERTWKVVRNASLVYAVWLMLVLEVGHVIE